MNSSSNKSRFHKIRLHGPWQFESSRRIGENPNSRDREFEKRKIQLPGKLDQFSDDSLAGEVKLLRAFGCPTELTADQNVWLVIESTGVVGKVFLNDQDLGELNADGLRVEIGHRLQQRNSLRIEPKQERNDASEISIQSVRLEIEERD